MVVYALRLQENLMRVFIRKSNHLIFNRWAITRAHAVDMPSIHGGPIEVLANDLMSFLVGVRYSAGDLRRGYRSRKKGKYDRLLVARLFLQNIPVNGSAVQARRCSCLQPSHRKAEGVDPLSETNGGSVAHPTALTRDVADMNDATQKGSSG